MKFQKFFQILCSGTLFLQAVANEDAVYEKSSEEFIAYSAKDLKHTIVQSTGHVINFNNVSIQEFVKFVSKIAGVNFIYNESLLDFNITLVSGKPASSSDVLKALIKILEQHELCVREDDSYFMIQKEDKNTIALATPPSSPASSALLVAQNDLLPFTPEQLFRESFPKKEHFHVYKLQYHQGGEILQAIKQMGTDLGSKGSPRLMEAIHTLQWIKGTNSLLFSGDDSVIEELNSLVASLDTPLKQVFIDVLVIETDVKNTLDFGLQWSGSGKYRESVGVGFGNFPPGPGSAPLAGAIQNINGTTTPQGASDFDLGKGFDLGVIGDIILHKGRSFFSLASLVSALQMDGQSTIVLNQKIITQDNKPSSIFVGDNIPFTGSVVQTIGASQQTTANIEYRDVGVSLNITPLLGQNDIITLDISEEISEAAHNHMSSLSNAAGIQTTKTNMLTSVHIPDQHFLVLSGMIRNSKRKRKSGLPCLGGLPLIGALFSKDQIDNEKRNIIVFIRPQIVNSIEQYQQITYQQEKIYKTESSSKDFESGLRLLEPIILDEQHGNK